MTQGLEQYHLTHLKISLIYLLNLRYKVLQYKVLIYDFPYLPRYKSENARQPVFVDDKNHEQDTSHVYLIIIFISPLEIGVTYRGKANGSSLLLISFNGFPITVFGNDARVCKPYNEFISCKNLVISYCFLTFYELFQFIEGLILF